VPAETDSRAERLLAQVSSAGRLAVAFSGGADSALVLAAAARSLGSDNVLALTADSASLASGELAAARAFAASLGVAHHAPRTRETDDAGYRANTPNRCYFCKSTVLDALAETAARHHFPLLATGTNADDAADPYRPGVRAGRERGVLTPLLDAGLTKADVRAISRDWGLATWEKPATPCLASRIRHGVPVDPPRLARVDRAERAVAALLERAGLPWRDLRVRDLGTGVRVEVDAARVTATAALPALAGALAEAGFADVPFTVAPFRSGSLNEAGGGASARSTAPGGKGPGGVTAR
jgi:uncharacterized protein